MTVHDVLMQFTYLIPNFWGTVPHAVNWVLLLFVVVCFVVALRVIVKALPALLLIGAVFVC